MAKEADDLSAVRVISDTLKPFNKPDQERIIRWVREKLGLSMEVAQSERHDPSPAQPHHPSGTSRGERSHVSIREFLEQKQPKGERQLAAAVAYYHRFEASEPKDSITKDDLLNACRLAGIRRPKDPNQSLVNAQHAGLIDKGAERGTYVINSVGENLIGVALPTGSKSAKSPRR